MEIDFPLAQTSATSFAGLGRAETSFVFTGQSRLAKGVQLQPDIPSVIDPARGHGSTADWVTGDALVPGLRTTITF